LDIFPSDILFMESRAIPVLFDIFIDKSIETLSQMRAFVAWRD